ARTNEREGVDREAPRAPDLARENNRLIEAAPAQTLSVERDGNDDVDRVRAEQSAAALGHEPAERLSERYFASVFEALDHAAKRMLLAFVGRVARPRASAREMRRVLNAGAAEMIVAARIEKRPAANGADRAVDHPHARAAVVAEAIVGGKSRGAAEAAARRIKTVEQPPESRRNPLRTPRVAF